jgi:protein ImuA
VKKFERQAHQQRKRLAQPQAKPTARGAHIAHREGEAPSEPALCGTAICHAMRLISCHNGQLLTIDTIDSCAAVTQNSLLPAKIKLFSTTLPALDALLPAAGLMRGAVHELLWSAKSNKQDVNDFKPFFFAAWLARAAIKMRGGTGVPFVKKKKTLYGRDAHATSKKPIVWSDPRNELYPPALGALGIPLDRLFLLKPKTPEDEIWAVTQCLACKGVGATVAAIPRLTRIQARRLQLAAERGGGVGLILRPHDPNLTGSKEHAAATRWLIEPAQGERTIQRWKIQLIHGHGGQTHRSVYLEYDRDCESGSDETDRVRATPILADRPPQAPPAQKRARA